MLCVFDKAKSIFSETVSGQQKIKKAKMIAISLEQTSEKANTYFLSPNGKLPAHFVLDGTDIVKYDYNTTNVFPIDTKWSSRSKRIIEKVDLDLPVEITGNVKVISRPLTTKIFEDAQVPEKVVIYYSENTAEDFYIYLDRRDTEAAYHYIIDDEYCYQIVSPNKKCYTQNEIHIVVLGKNNEFDVYDRAAKLINQLLEEYGLTQYMPVEDTSHIHSVSELTYNAIEERLAVIRTSGGTSDEAPTSTRKDNTNPGDHIIHVKALYTSDKDFPRIEKALIAFVAEYLYYFNLNTTSVWRITDLVLRDGSTVFYNQEYELFLDCVDKVLAQLEQGVRQIEISNTGLPRYDEDGNVIILPWKIDTRDIVNTTYFLTTDQKSINQDYDSNTIGANVELRSKFEDGAGAFSETLKFSTFYYEPIYPDLTVPPRSATALYNKGLMHPKDILKEMEQPQKPVIGKTPNAFDPYPVDDKIAQLEMHTPIVTLEYENASDVNNNLFNYANNRFGNTEKRLVRIENILSTFMRYQARLSARININCVYYGGQSVFSKYSAIRCMCDDLTNDADTRTLDQCLNCSRYEPILGQFYEITGDSPGMAQIYDDVQASRMTKEEFAKFNNISSYSDAHEKIEEDVTRLHIRENGEKGYDELLDEANNFVMNWTETPYHEQSPHISVYEYDPSSIYRNKSDRLEDVYEDGYRELQQLKFQRPQYNMNSVGGGNFNPATAHTNGLNGLYNLGDYDLDPSDSRIALLDICDQLYRLAQNEKVLYTFGASVKPSYMRYSPSELYQKILENQEVNSFSKGRGDDVPEHKAIYFDCSAFASYIYIHIGVLKTAFSTSTLRNHTEFTCVLNNKMPLLEQVTKAYPGDLILYNTHVTIYAGEDYQYEASSDNNVPNREQIKKSKIRNAKDFVGIYRHKDLSTPVVKNKTGILISSTLTDYVNLQVGKNTGRDTNGDGYIEYSQKGDWLTDKDVLRNYIDPKKRLTPELKMQFASIQDVKVPGVIMESTINDFLTCVGGAAMKRTKGLKVDANYNPVRDENNNLVWEEKYVFPRGEVWLRAADKTGLNPLFLLIYCAIETEWCNTSNWTNYSEEFKAKKSDNYLFNAFNIWCTDEEYFPDQPALHRVTAKRKTEENEWFTIEKSVVEGAIHIANQFLSTDSVSNYGRRDTAYFMKWHMGKLIKGQNQSCEPGTQQSTTDVSWPDKYAQLLYTALKTSPMGREEAIKQFEYSVPQFADDNATVISPSLSAEGNKKDLGDFEITFYCPCSKCCGKTDGITASGEIAVEGLTIAADLSVIPMGSWVEIEGVGRRKVMDVGGGIKQKHIDVYVNSHKYALELGRITAARVYLIL